MSFENPQKHPLDFKYPDLQKPQNEEGKKSVVQVAVDRLEQDTGESVPNDPTNRIEAYLKRLENLILDPKEEQKKKELGDIEHTERPRALSLLRQMVLNEYVRPNKEQMAQGAARVEQRAARQMGIQAEYTDEALEQRGEIAVGDLESSLDQWINYLSDPNEPYPTWFRYYTFRNILNIGEYDKDKQEFPKRSKGTFKLFPDVDRGALAYVEEIMTASQDDTVLQRLRESQRESETPEAEMWTPEKAEAFTKLPFAKQYAEGVKSKGEITPELREETRGEWVHYHQNDDPKELWKSLQNKGTAWCTKGYPTAKTQLGGGDFYIYYTLDATGKPNIPRIAIRMEGQDKIAEDPRGVFDSKQNLEPNMIDILDDKLQEFGEEADTYRKKSNDMKILTALDQKHESSQSLTKEDLTFLYEIDSKIEGFGYGKDPRIDELRKDRNIKEDLSFVLSIPQDKISITEEEALKGGIKYHYGNLNLNSLKTAEGLTLPQSISGDLDLYGLETAEGLTLPQSIGGNLNLHSLETPEGLTLPQSIGGNLNLYGLKTAEGLTLPQSIGGDLDLNNLKTAEGLTLPQSIGGNLNLRGLETAEGLTLPQSVGGYLNLRGLKTTKGLTLPQSISGDLYLNSLETPEGLTLPQSIGGDLNLRGLETAKGLTLPQSISGELDLRGLTTAEGLTLPQSIGGGLYLSGLETSEGLTLPQSISGDLYLSSLKTAEGLTLPQSISGYLNLYRL